MTRLVSELQLKGRDGRRYTPLSNLLHQRARSTPTPSSNSSKSVPKDNTQGAGEKASLKELEGYVPGVVVGRLEHLCLHLWDVEHEVLGLVIVRLDVVHGDLGELISEGLSQMATEGSSKGEG